MPPMSLPADVMMKKIDAVGTLRSQSKLIVALSGGVDSAVLLAIAREALGPDRLVAVTGRSDAVTDEEIEDAARVASGLGVRHRVVRTFEIEREAYRSNAGDRCFHCRTELFEVLARLAAEADGARVAYGAILDDLGDHRPGMRAAAELGVLAPLVEARICKLDVRALAEYYDLHVGDKPASACLASRIPIGVEVTPERLGQVARAEREMRSLGFRQFRVRHHGDIARIELGPGEADRLLDPALRAEIASRVKAAGFRFVALDLEGYREGSLNPAPAEPLYSIAPKREGGQ
jgi:pyridinium-3,5-biscarboxylic acid mononucleotide sulfurtransferase